MNFLSTTVQEQSVCQICCHEYSESIKITQLQPCLHDLCFGCFRKSVLKELKCPFCQQQVSQTKTTDGQFQQDLLELQALYSVEIIDQKEENNGQLDYLNHDFFIEDLATLQQHLIQTCEQMKITVKYSSQHADDFEEKWYMYEQIASHIEQLQHIIYSEELMNPAFILNEINRLNQELVCLRNSNWQSEHLQPYKIQYQFSRIEDRVENDESEEIHLKFIIQKKRKGKGKRK